MITTHQINFTKKLRSYFKVKEYRESILPQLGYTAIEKTQQSIHIEKSLSKDDFDAVYVHEYGHIYYDHNYVNEIDYHDDIQKIFKKYHPGFGKLDINGIHKIINICMDIQVNSTLLTIEQLNAMKSHGYQMCTAEFYEVEPGLEFDQYFDPVIKKLIFIKVNSGGNINIKAPQSEGDMNVGGTIDLPTFDVHDDGNGNLGKNLDGSDIGGDLEDLKSEVKSDCDEVEVARGELHSTRTPNRKVDLTHNIATLLIKISGVDINMGTNIDSLRRYNQKSRPSTALYSSYKSKLSVLDDKPKLGVLIDVSGSMGLKLPSIIYNTLKRYRSLFHRSSRLVSWDVNIVDECNLRQLPIKYKLGSGTNLAPGVKYLIDKYNFDKILVISDFYDTLPKIESELKSKNKKGYYISYGESEKEIRSKIPSMEFGLYIKSDDLD